MASERRPADCFNTSCPDPRHCWGCGFTHTEDERRKKIPFTIDKDGLRRKLIRPLPKPKQEGVKPNES